MFLIERYKLQYNDYQWVYYQFKIVLHNHIVSFYLKLNLNIPMQRLEIQIHHQFLMFFCITLFSVVLISSISNQVGLHVSIFFFFSHLLFLIIFLHDLDVSFENNICRAVLFLILLLLLLSLL